MNNLNYFSNGPSAIQLYNYNFKTALKEEKKERKK